MLAVAGSSPVHRSIFLARVVQLGERHIRNVEVSGSNPLVGPIFSVCMHP